MIAITYDTDHMTDELMANFLHSVYRENLPGTFFCTQYYSELQNRNLDIAIHPIFDNTTDWLGATELLILEHKKHGVFINGVRPHSCANSQRYSVQIKEIGLDYCSQLCIPTDYEIAPFKDDWGIVQFPIRFMDNANLSAHSKLGTTSGALSKKIIDTAINSKELFVFDFHPIHLLLNTSDLKEYSAWRKSGELIINNSSYGVRDFYNELVWEIERSGVEINDLQGYTNKLIT